MDTLYCFNGLGDKLLDLLSFIAFNKCKNINEYKIVFNSKIHKFKWGNAIYDIRLFDFDKQLNILNSKKDGIVHRKYPAFYTSPYIIKIEHPEILIDTFIAEVKNCRSLIKPSCVISKYIPYESLTNAFGVHLRNTDKITLKDTRIRNLCENKPDEYQKIHRLLLVDLENIIINEDVPTFFLCSENHKYKKK